MRPIDADALIIDLMDAGLDQIQMGDYSEVIQVIERQPTVNQWHRVEEPPKWVSVFDDLPRHNAVVVVSDGKRSWDVGQYHFLFKADDRTIWWWKKHTTRKVLWWMYKEDAIPEPPKEEEHGN